MSLIAAGDAARAQPSGQLREAVLVAQRSAGNRAVTAALQRNGKQGARRQGKVTIASGIDAAAPNFFDAFARYTTEDAFNSGPQTFPSDETGDKSLDSALANARWIMTILTDPKLFDQLAVAAPLWDMNRPTVSKIFSWARLNDFPATDAMQGLNRLERRMFKTEAALSVRASSATAQFAAPTAATTTSTSQGRT